MPPAEVNALVRKHCVSCHDDAQMVGRLTLQRFDAAEADPSLVAMLASKVNDGALGAGGEPLPDRPTINAFQSALDAGAAGATEWHVSRADAGLVTAGIVQQSPSGRSSGRPDLYRLALTCRPDTREGQMQLAWAPLDVDSSGAKLAVAPDDEAPRSFPIAVGQGAVDLHLPLPRRNLSISGLLPGEKVTFPFSSLPEPARQAFAACFGSGARP